MSRHGEAIYLMVSEFAAQLANENVDTFELHLPQSTVWELVVSLDKTYSRAPWLAKPTALVVLAGPLGEIRIKVLEGTK